MSLKTFARPYAKAVFMDALQNKRLEKWAKLLAFSSQALKEKQVKQYLADPRLSNEERLQTLHTICQSALFDEGKQFLKLMVEKKRWVLLPAIEELFKAYRIEHDKIIQAVVTSAKVLSEEQREPLRAALERKLNRRVEIAYETDEALLGGVVVRAGDWVMDDSIRGKLARLSAELLQ